MAGHRGTAGGRDRRLDDAEHPASRKPERRRPAHHAGPRARDRARRGVRRGGRAGSRRSAAGRAPQAAWPRARSTFRTRRHGRVDNFFRPNNLVALRELALRRAAERIDSDLLERMQGSGVDGPWAAGERILVCVGADEISPAVVRHAKRLADAIGAPWMAVTVERPSEGLGSDQRRRVDEALQLAARLGADETKTLVAGDIVQELLRFARFENVTQIVVGRSRGGWWSELLGRSLPHQLVHHAEDIAVHVVTAKDGQTRTGALVGPPATDEAGSAVGAVPVVGARRRRSDCGRTGDGIGRLAAERLDDLPGGGAVRRRAVRDLAGGLQLDPVVPRLQLLLHRPGLHLHGRASARTAGPLHLPRRGRPDLGPGRTGPGAGGGGRQPGRGRRGVSTSSPAGFPASPMRTRSPKAAAVELNGYLSRPAAILLPQGDILELAASWPPEDELDTASASAARWAYEKDEAAGAGTDTLPSARWLFLPLRSSRGRVGVVGVALDEGRARSRDPHPGRDGGGADGGRSGAGAADAGDRGGQHGGRVGTGAQHAAGVDQPRLPHASRLHSRRGDQPDRLWRRSCRSHARRDLLDQVKDEAEHLDRMVRNLLSMTRVEAGALELRRDWVDVREAFDRVVALAKTTRGNAGLPSRCRPGAAFRSGRSLSARSGPGQYRRQCRPLCGTGGRSGTCGAPGWRTTSCCP